MNIISTIGGVIAGGLIATGVGVATASTTATTTAATSVASTWQPPARAHWMRTKCVDEDSLGCAWNAALQGNGSGHSFYVVKRHLIGPYGRTRGRVVCVFYVKHADAVAWDACHKLPKSESGHLS